MIKVMNEILANKIAAGEVIERCVSIVKELVENSIDAKASKVKVELKNSGINEIKVIDNGIGMNSTDAEVCFLRHATSKLLTEDDLFNINSLGFRGEALPSIASVSDVILKTSNGSEGTLIHIKGGKIISKEDSDLRCGTEITISKLFYNTPARLKHLSSLYTELSHITEFMNKIALSYPDISFVLTNDGKTLLNTTGDGNLLKVINNIYGIDVTKKMIEINDSNEDYSISGYISLPEVTRNNRNNMITIVNGRIVKNTSLNRCINDAYHTYKPDDKYPIVVIKIDVDSTQIDVNIHPTKQDIKFDKLDELLSLIDTTIKDELNKKMLIPKVENNNTPIRSISSINIKEEKPISYEEMTLDLDYEPVVSDNIEVIEDNTYIEERHESVPMMYPVGLVKGTYIICQNELGMYLIDQHAANERINYEYYFYAINNKTDVISFTVPLTFSYTSNETIILKENINVLRDLLFDIEEFGVNTFIVRSYPAWIQTGMEEVAIKKILDLVIEKEKNFDKYKFNDRVAMTISCKASIKANDNISIKEMEVLVNRLRNCKNPYTCPHGRPTIIFYSNYELEKLFKRAME